MPILSSNRLFLIGQASKGLSLSYEDFDKEDDEGSKNLLELENKRDIYGQFEIKER